MALEGLNVGFNMKTVRADRKETAAEEDKGKIKLNFKTVARKGGPVTIESETITWCENRDESDVSELWKRLFIRKEHTTEMAKQYKDVCHYLTQKYGCDLPKRSHR